LNIRNHVPSDTHHIPKELNLQTKPTNWY
jgi:hypothetical protein